MYKVKKGIKKYKNQIYFNWMICNPVIPEFHLCKFLDIKGKQSKYTQKTYSSILVQYLNFLEQKRDKKYNEIAYEDLNKYFYSLIFFSKNENLIINPEITYKTLKMKHTVIIEFYKFLQGENIQLFINVDKLNQSGKNSIELYMVRYKKSRKDNYIMEYTDDDIKIIVSNFNTLRDKSIFLLTLFGMRIDEVLSIKSLDFNYSENIIKPSRSKTIKNRFIVISSDVSKIIQNYIQTERIDAIINSGKDSEYLFINIKKGKYCGLELKYQTFYKALKTAGINAGYTKEQIRTHSGRSTRVMELLKENVSDEIIRHILGWKNSSSMKDYIDEYNKTLSIKGAKFMAEINEY